MYISRCPTNRSSPTTARLHPPSKGDLPWAVSHVALLRCQSAYLLLRDEAEALVQVGQGHEIAVDQVNHGLYDAVPLPRLYVADLHHNHHNEFRGQQTVSKFMCVNRQSPRAAGGRLLYTDLSCKGQTSTTEKTLTKSKKR